MGLENLLKELYVASLEGVSLVKESKDEFKDFYFALHFEPFPRAIDKFDLFYHNSLFRINYFVSKYLFGYQSKLI